MTSPGKPSPTQTANLLKPRPLAAASPGKLSPGLHLYPHRHAPRPRRKVHQDSRSREVEANEAEEWIKQAGVEMYFETSAKTAQNVVRAFEEVCKQLLLLNMRKTEDREKGFKLKDEEKDSSFCC
jgi:hypothetical protein